MNMDKLLVGEQLRLEIIRIIHHPSLPASDLIRRAKELEAYISQAKRGPRKRSEKP